ncbi:hypothetical protein BKK81_23675 [Cupriavidus sp. USMAHM13]|uniref:hypothetical protein n=1 Tax=Cupriavidus sp. USMAHM13 TaxID=1389192 RepID=UPI0008A6F044|nr:hypothetical protein [Cupriavidus sp. USMAHM13]AOZ02285.1 hypothetical protein BKK81_23675 [Cupriavidus sp. USMAHM13]
MYNALIQAFHDAQEQSARAFRAVMVLESQLGLRMEASAVPPLPDAAAERKRFCRRIAARMIRRAAERFGANGLPVRVDETRIAVDGHANIWEAIETGRLPDLDRFWAALRAACETRTAEPPRAAMVQALARSLGLGQPAAVRWHASTARLRLDAPSEPVPGGPCRRLAAPAQETVRQSLLALAAFAQEAGAGALAGCLRQFDHRAPFRSPQRRTFPALDITQYNAYWEVRLERALAEALLRFVARQGGIPLPPCAA